MSEERCVSCPFRVNDNERAFLMRQTNRAPSEFWPCHEALEFDDLTDIECVGHRNVAEAANKQARVREFPEVQR